MTLRPEWLGAALPLGSSSESEWTPLGIGTLLSESGVLWLLSTRSVVEQAGPGGVVAWPAEDALLRLEDAPDAGLAWVFDPELDLAARPFPVDPAWSLKAFTAQQCAGYPVLEAGLPALTLGFPYTLVSGSGRRPGPLILDGVVAAVDEAAHAVLTSAPRLPRCAGSPLLVRSPTAPLALAGLATRNAWIPNEEADLPPTRITAAVAAPALIALLRSPAATAMRQRVQAVDTGE